MLRDWADFVTFYDFPADHWIYLKTTHPIESVFAGVRLAPTPRNGCGSGRTRSTSNTRSCDGGASTGGLINGALNLMAMVVTGEVFKEGVLEGSYSELEVMTA